METIKTYLDNMFRSWPETDEVMRIKSELLSDMTDKYNELKAEGKSENEAVGIVISEFGNIDELMQEMQIDRQTKSTERDGGNLRYVDQEEAEAFLHVKEGNGKRVGCGIAFILFGVAILMLLSSAGEYMPGGEDHFPGNLFSLGGILLLLFCIIAGVALFLYSDALENKYKYLEDAFRLDDSFKSVLLRRRDENQPAYAISVIAGVSLCIAAAVPVISAAFLSPDNDFISAAAMAVTLMLVAAAVYLFVSFGERKEAYDKLLQEGEFTAEKKKSNKIVGMAGSIVWPIVTVLFLVKGFTRGEWASAAVIYPVTGILFGVFSAVVKNRSQKED